MSLVMRHVTRHEVRRAKGDESSPWEVRCRNAAGAWGKWARVKAAKRDDGQPLGQTARLEDRRTLTATRLRKQQLEAMDSKWLREVVGKVGMDTRGKKKKELADCVLRHQAS